MLVVGLLVEAEVPVDLGGATGAPHQVEGVGDGGGAAGAVGEQFFVHVWDTRHGFFFRIP